MIPAARFAPLGTQEQEILQPECPVYVHCTRRSVERESGTPFLQVRMVNRADRPVGTVYLRIEGLDASGQVRYTLRELALTGLHAAPRAVFGEERMLVLPRKKPVMPQTCIAATPIRILSGKRTRKKSGSSCARMKGC